MKNRSLTIAGILLLAGVLMFSACGAPAASQTGTQQPIRTITVVGQGKASGAPTVAHINIGVETSAPSAQEAMDANRARMTTLLEKIKALGIAEKDIQTSNFSIYTEQRPVATATGKEEFTVSYRVSNQVSLTIRDVAKLGDILDQAVAAGANNVYGVYFGMESTAELEAQAREKAVADAQARAEALASLSGVSVGEVISISEVIGTPSPVYYGLAKVEGMGGATPIQPGEYEMTMSVQVTYAIR
ncbi:MAG: SIMPL domain-containing protein [Anaerolineales bacterium]